MEIVVEGERDIVVGLGVRLGGFRGNYNIAIKG